MAEILRVKQPPIIPLASIEVYEATIVKEPYLRRAAPDFAYEVGGPTLRLFLEQAYASGYVSQSSLVRSQPTRFRYGAYPTPPHWHFDFNPGITPSSYRSLEEAIQSNTGVIGCLFDPTLHPDDTGTLFAQDGEIILDLGMRNADHEYVPGKNFDPAVDSGEVYWWDPAVRQQLEGDEGLRTEAAAPNVINAYDSSNMHCVPVMLSDRGWRLLARVNTPSGGVITPENKMIMLSDPNFPDYAFYSTGPTTWIRTPNLVK